MSRYRQIHTKIWVDNWFIDLTPKAKLLFVYLFSNDRTTLSGLYELPLRVISFETGLSSQFVGEQLSSFERDNKVYYRDGIVWVVNLMRYNARNLSSPKIRACIAKEIQTINPGCSLYKAWAQQYQDVYPIDTLSMPYQYPINGVSKDDDRFEHDHEHDHDHDHDGIDRVEIPYQYPIDTLSNFEEVNDDHDDRLTILHSLILQAFSSTVSKQAVQDTAEEVGGLNALAKFLDRARAYEPEKPLAYVRAMYHNGGDEDDSDVKQQQQAILAAIG